MFEVPAKEAKQPMAMAERLLVNEFTAQGGRPGIYRWGTDWLLWDPSGQRWDVVGTEIVEDRVWKALHLVVVKAYDPEKEEMVSKPFGPNKDRVSNIVRAMEAVVRLVRAELPFWVGEQKLPGRADHVIAYQDVLLHVDASAKAGTFVTTPRDDRWVDPYVLPVKWAPEAVAPTWVKACEEWGSGDVEWVKRLERMSGYVLMSTRKYARWFLPYGKIRGGKGTSVQPLRWLLGGAVYQVRMEDMAGQFGLDGVQHARMLLVGEVRSLEKGEGEKLAGLTKMVLGADGMTIDGKWKMQLKNVVVKAVPVYLANVIPNLPDQGQGLSGKLVPLPFANSWVGREDTDLADKLRDELEGIAARFGKAAIELEGERDMGRKWGVVEEAAHVVEDYRQESNVWDSFLGECCSKNPDGFVEVQLLVKVWNQWKVRHRVKDAVPDYRVASLVARESSWDLRRVRGAKGVRGLKGLSLKAGVVG